MIIDTLDNLEKYVSLNPLFKDVVDFLKSNDLNNLEPGKHLIKDTDVFVNVQTAKSKTRSEAVFEYHRKFRFLFLVMKNMASHHWKIFLRQNSMRRKMWQRLLA